jgi:DNA-binding NarL/FixJ family response regulator
MPITVFLADDHAVIRDGLRALLAAQADIRVVGDSGSGRETVRQVGKLSPDVVVMDISIPDLNGIAAAERIREACPDTQVLILSVHTSGEYVFRALKAGALGYVLKESAGQEVVNAVRAVHAGQRYLSPRITDTIATDFVRLRQELPDKTRWKAFLRRNVRSSCWWWKARPVRR